MLFAPSGRLEVAFAVLIRLGLLVKRLVLVLILIGLALHLYAVLLRVAPVPVTATMIERHMAGADLRRDGISLDAVSPHVVRAIIAAEDSLYCEHHGVDWDAVSTAWSDWRAGGRLRGASTITQQTAKNVFFWNGGGFPRKAGDAWMALFVDKAWGKRRTFEIYLNVAEWGDGVFGIEAAARARFGKSAADLSAREAALLAAVLPNPHRWRVDPPGPYVRERAGTLVARMHVVETDGLADCLLN